MENIRIQKVAEFLLENTFYASQTVFFIYCLAVSYRQRKSNSWTALETWQNPIGSLVSAITVNLGGFIIINGIVKGLGIASVIQDDIKVLSVFGAWILIYYSPFDIVYAMMDLKPVQIVISLLMGWKRSRDILNGVFEGKTVYRSFSVSVLLGVLYGWGGSLLYPFEAKTRGKSVPNDLHMPSLSFMSVVISVLGASLFGPAYGYTGSSFLSMALAFITEHIGPGLKQNPGITIVLTRISLSKDSIELFVLLVTGATVLLYECGLISLFLEPRPRSAGARVPSKLVKASDPDSKKKK